MKHIRALVGISFLFFLSALPPTEVAADSHDFLRATSSIRSRIAKAISTKETGLSGFGRTLAEDESWECKPGENEEESCCGAVPKIVAVFQGTSCEKHFPVVALALGIENPAVMLPGASPMPHLSSVIETSLEAYCPSFCFRVVKNIIDEYSKRSALKGRLCAQVMDGLWRLQAVCARDGKDDLSGSYCLTHYMRAYDAFGSLRAVTTRQDVTNLCSAPCVNRLLSLSVNGSAVIGKSLMATEAFADEREITALELASYAYARSSILTRMLGVLCSTNPTTGEYCVLETNLLGRPAESVRTPGLITPTPEDEIHAGVHADDVQPALGAGEEVAPVDEPAGDTGETPPEAVATDDEGVSENAPEYAPEPEPEPALEHVPEHMHTVEETGEGHADASGDSAHMTEELVSEEQWDNEHLEGEQAEHEKHREAENLRRRMHAKPAGAGGGQKQPGTGRRLESLSAKDDTGGHGGADTAAHAARAADTKAETAPKETSKRRLVKGMAAAADSDDVYSATETAPTSDLTDADDLNTAIMPVRRPGFACTYCGKTLITGLLDIADIFGIEKPAGISNPSTEDLRTAMTQGCGTHSDGRTCLQMLADSTPASARYDPTLGLAVQSISLCAEYAAKTATDPEAECPNKCALALTSLMDTFGCCLVPYLRMTHAFDMTTIPDMPAFIDAASKKCGLSSDFLTHCYSNTRSFVAVRLGNIKPSFAKGKHAQMFNKALVADLARATSTLGVFPMRTSHSQNAIEAGSGVFSVSNIMSEGNEVTTVAVVSVVPSSNYTRSELVMALQEAFKAGSVPFHNVVSLAESVTDHGAGTSEAYVKIGDPVSVSDATAAYAPPPQAVTDKYDGSGAGSISLSATVSAIAIILSTILWALS